MSYIVYFIFLQHFYYFVALNVKNGVYKYLFVFITFGKIIFLNDL